MLRFSLGELWYVNALIVLLVASINTFSLRIIWRYLIPRIFPGLVKDGYIARDLTLLEAFTILLIFARLLSGILVVN